MVKISFSFITILSIFSIPGYAQTRDAVLVRVPDINGRAISLIKPAFPETAVDVGADGDLVTLIVVVDENGNAVSADCSTSCHPMLKDAAELAAMTSKFKPLIREGRAVRYRGILSYTFVVNRVNWYRFGTSLESARQFDNISLGPAAQILSKEFASEKASLVALDDGDGADYETRQKVITEAERSVKSKLKDADLWWFEYGIALRRITFWTQAAEPVDRALLQKAIDDLPRYIASAPDDISEDHIKRLTDVSKYRIPAKVSDQELKRAIYKLTKDIPRPK